MGFKENVSVTLDISANIAQVRSAANELQNILSKSNFSSGFSSKITGMVSQLNDALSQLETKGSKAITGLGDVKGVETSIGKVSTIIRNIAVELDRAGASGSKSLLAMINGMDSKLEQASSAQKQYTKSIQETQSEADKLAKSLDKVQKAQAEAERKNNEALARSNAAKAKIQAAEQAKANLRSSSGRTAKSLDSEIEAKMARIKELQALMSDVAGGGKKLRLFETDKSSFSKDQVEQITKYQNIVSSLTGEVERLKQEWTALNEEIAKQNEVIKKAKSEQTKADTDQQRSVEDYVKQTAAIQTVQDQIKQLNQTTKDTAAFDEYKQKLSEIFGDETLKNATSIDELNTALERLKESGIKMTADQLQKLLSISSGMGTPLKEMGEKARQAGDGFKQMTDKAQDLDMLTYRLKYFFSMVGGFQLFRRAIRSSIETIKELDAAMTQTAVVSTKTVGQMWKTLPEYTQKAKTLAASIKDVYSAQTLYVQQGLSMDAALNLGVETLKMARVAGIDAATATDSMTAALRGFKMELNETSATRINDVYSKLAQNTASNVQEISTAMSKVASLASNANMSFENTAAYLSKIIETTREGAETAGTALKTVIARFSEVKKLYSEGELLGTDEEGQEVDVNKLSKALRTAGINMNEYFTGAVGLDTIFGELGKKWSSLTTIQQRYIATQAAGSRQQSRFIALMQDWNRTSDLMRMAYDAEGSGQEQFEKTLDSLDAKLTKLKTEWQNFIMGIANSDLVKGFIDFGSKLLETINNVIDKLSGGNGLAKSILSVAAAFGVFKVGGMAVRGILNNVGMALGTRAAGSAGIGAGLAGMKQNFAAYRQVIHPFAGVGKKGKDRIQDQGLKSYGEKTSGRYNRAAVVSGQAFAVEERAAYDKKSAELALMKSQGQDAWVEQAKRTGQLTGKETADEQAAAYQEAIDKKQEEVNTAKKEVGAVTTQQQTAQLQAYGAALQGIGMAAGIAAGALFLLANHLEQSKKYSGLAKVAKGLAVGLTVLSVSFMLLGTAAQIAGAMVAAGAKTAETAIKAIPIIGWILAIISVIISLITILKEVFKQKPEEEVWKEFEEGCEKAAEEAKKVQDAYKDALSKIKDISAKEAKLDELVYGTEEWNTAVQELNESILELVKLYPALAGAVDYVNDHLVLNTQSQVYKDWLKEQQKIARHAGIVEKASTYGKDYEGAKRDTKNTLKTGLKQRYVQDEVLVSSGQAQQSYASELKDYNFIFKDGKIVFGSEEVKPFYTEDYLSSEYIYNGQFYKPGTYFATSQSTDGNIHLQEGGYNAAYVDAFDYLYLAELMGGELPFLGENAGFYDAEDTERSDLLDYVKDELSPYKLTKEDMQNFYRDVSDPLAEAINNGEVSDLASAFIFLQEWTKTEEGKTYQQNGKDVLGYFKNLWTNGSSFDQNIPLAVLLQSYSKISGAQKDLAGSTLGIRQEEVEKLKIPKEWTNAYLKFGAEAFSKAFESIQDSDITTRNNKNGPDWATYAAARGIENTEENFNNNKKEFELYLKYLVAAEKIYSQDNKEFKDFDDRFRRLENDTHGAVSLIASGDNKNLTVEQIDRLREINNAKDLELFSKYFGVTIKDLTDQFDNLFNGIDEGVQGQIKGIATTWGETQSLISGYSRAQATGVEDAGKTFLENIGQIYNLINDIADPDKLKEARDILASIDWTNTDSINKAIRELDKLGVTVDSVLVKELAKATGAVSNFNAKSLEEKVEQLETARSAGDKIKEGKTSVTGKEYKALLETAFSEYNQEGRNWSADWVQVGLDEWVYIGNETNALLSSIDSSVAALLQNTIAEKQQQVTEGKKVKGLLTGEEIEEKEKQVNQGKETEDRLNGESSKDGLIKSGGATGFNTLGMPMRLNIGATGAILGANIEGAGFGESGYILVDDNNKDVYGPPAPSPKEITFKYKDKENGDEFKEVTGAEDFARMIMAEGATASDFNADSLVVLGKILQLKPEQLEQAPEQLFETLRLALEDWYNLSTNETILSQSKELLSAMMAQNSSNQQLLGQANTYNGYEQTEQERTTAAGILQGRIQSEEIEGTYEVMKEEGQQWAEEHEQKLFDENDPQTLEQMNNGYKALALTSNEAVKNIDNLNSALGDNWDAFKKATKGTPAYTAALNKLLPALRKVFGDKVDSKWIKEHEELLDKWAKGGDAAEEAINEFAQEASKSLEGTLEKSIETTNGEVLNLNDHIAKLDGSQLEVGATANFGDLNNQLMMTAAQAETTAASLNSIPGVSVVWVKTGTALMPDGSTRETGYFQITKNGAAGSTPPKGGGGGGGGKEFKNDFDKYYNQVEDINELIRLRNLLETDYNQLLKAEGTSGKQIYDNLKKQVDLLKERQKLTADLAEKRKGQIFDLLNDEEYKDVKQYAWWNEEDQTIEIDWDAINEIKDSKTGDKIKELVQKLEDFQSKYDEQIEALEEIEDALEDIRKRGRDEYISLEERLRDALIAKIQEQIDEQTATNEAIDTANTNLMDSIQKALEQQRQERENVKTEEELADKEQRLAYLQQDSSGANQVEIEKLQKELDEAREDYTDQLIDQKISELQEQNDEAAQQRQEQIDLMQQSLDWQEKNGEFWEQAYQILEQSIGPDGSLLKGSELEQLLKTSEGWQGLSQEGKMNWLRELETLVAQAVGYLSLTRQLEDIGVKSGTKITFTDVNGITHTGIVDKDGNVVVTDENGNETIWKDVFQNYDGSYRTLESEESVKPEQTTPDPGGGGPGRPSSDGKKYWTLGTNTVWKHPKKATNGNGEYATEADAATAATKANDSTAASLEAEKTQLESIVGPLSLEQQNRLKAVKQLLAYRSSVGYKMGGLNTKTGPAWLDGTLSKPELVLNARDTENFIQLKDHLATLRQMSTNGIFGSGGDNYYDIEVHVDSLGSDYDVDMAIDRIKARLYQDGAYRNVNTLNRLR